MEIIDKVNRWVGVAVAWLIPVLILELVYDTIARYAFNAPTVWSYDISYILYGTIFMLGSAHTLQIDRHVRIETFYEKMSPKGKALMDIVAYVVFFFPVMISLVYFSSQFALKSWQMLERSGESMWQPPIYPFKTVLPLAALLILIQGVVQFVRSIQSLRGAHHAD